MGSTFGCETLMGTIFCLKIVSFEVACARNQTTQNKMIVFHIFTLTISLLTIPNISPISLFFKSCSPHSFSPPTLLHRVCACACAGGEGKVGKVVDIRGWDTESGRSVASVTWSNGTTNVYRMGHKGKVDLKYVSDVQGGFYYKDHLPKLGMKLGGCRHKFLPVVKETCLFLSF